MKKKAYSLYLEDILNAMRKIESYTSGMSYEDFIKNPMACDAVIRNLEIIGEAARSIPQSIRQKHSEIPWSRMIGLRNIMIHQYANVDLGIVWTIITKNIPGTKSMIEDLLKDNG